MTAAQPGDATTRVARREQLVAEAVATFDAMPEVRRVLLRQAFDRAEEQARLLIATQRGPDYA